MKKYAKLKLNKYSIRFAKCFISSECKVKSSDLFEANLGTLIYADRDGFLVLRDGVYSLETEILIPFDTQEFHVPTAFTSRVLVFANGISTGHDDSFAITNIKSDSQDRFVVNLRNSPDVVSCYSTEIYPAFEHMIPYVYDMEIVEE